MSSTNVTLHVQSGNDALHRVICVCRRRGLEIVELSYANEQIKLKIAGAERQMRQIDRWLAALVNVFQVDRSEPPGLESAVPAAETAAPGAPPRPPHEILADTHYFLRHANATAP
jgi:acetolactate synthase regulatory subunit